MKRESYPWVTALVIAGAFIVPPILPAAEKDMMKDEKGMMEKDMMKEDKGMMKDQKMKESKDAMMKDKMKTEKTGKGGMSDDKRNMDEKMK